MYKTVFHMTQVKKKNRKGWLPGNTRTKKRRKYDKNPNRIFNQVKNMLLD